MGSGRGVHPSRPDPAVTAGSPPARRDPRTFKPVPSLSLSKLLRVGEGRMVKRLKHIAEHVDGEVAFGAYTGKAALVLRTKGCTDASTIHSMIYRSRESDENGPQFVINRQSPASKADLIIIDECSMVDEELGRDLLSFGQPVLVLGDPAQLPPVKGGGCSGRRRLRSFRISLPCPPATLSAYAA